MFWQTLNADSTTWDNAESPQRVYLYNLKALSFILLRLGSVDESYRALEKLYELDPSDNVGASAIRELARGIIEEDS